MKMVKDCTYSFETIPSDSKNVILFFILFDVDICNLRDKN